MIRTIPVLALLLLPGCATLQADLTKVNDAIAAGERNLALICQQMPLAAVGAQTVACIARANGTAQDVVARSIAAAQAICAGTANPPSVQSAIAQISRAAQAAANASAAGCSP